MGRWLEEDVCSVLDPGPFLQENDIVNDVSNSRPWHFTVRLEMLRTFLCIYLTYLFK